MPRSSSSSSDEEEDRRIKQLREIAVSFDSLNQNKDEKPSSKRHQKSEEDPNAFEVTPEFQEFVAKKLRKKLDESIELIPNYSNKQTNLKSNNEEYKFQLLKNVYLSNECSLDIQNSKDNADKKKKHKKNKKSKKVESESDSDDDNMNMFKEAAIDVNFLAKTTYIQEHKKEFLSSI